MSFTYCPHPPAKIPKSRKRTNILDLKKMETLISQVFPPRVCFDDSVERPIKEEFLNTNYREESKIDDCAAALSRADFLCRYISFDPSWFVLKFFSSAWKKIVFPLLLCLFFMSFIFRCFLLIPLHRKKTAKRKQDARVSVRTC